MTSTSWSRKTTRSRWERLEELFNRAVDLPEDARETFIREETGEDTELRDELLGLLACDTGKRTGPLTHALGEALDSTTRDKRRAHLNKVVGNYRLVSVLGHGGTGTVYLGERADSQYSAQVAVKIVESAAVHSDLATRFRAERQILASLNHPNIARLMDAGESEDGQPYLVMEYIQGDPLDKYCDERKLDVQARLRLFLEICGAVQYAHQNLVVHRDLKPANILVTKEGVAKLLDFGIAKLLDPGSSSSALALTRMNDRLLTPEYASPEQILGKPVTATSDVYALGVVLYELLTGLRPFVVEATASQLELERSICVTDPPRPSATLELGKTLPPDDHRNPTRIALARSLNPERLRRRLAGDLDSIIMRALRKEPQHRYGSVDQLMADIRRYLANEPVQARQGNWIYYSKRFVRRNALAVSAASLFVVLTAGFVTSVSMQMRKTAEQRDRAVTTLALMKEVFNAANLWKNPGSEVSARALLDRAAERIRQNMSVADEIRAELLSLIGTAYLGLKETRPAIDSLNESLRLWASSSTPEDAKVAEALRELGNAHRIAGNAAAAEVALTRAFAILRRQNREESLEYASVQAEYARLDVLRGNQKKAETLFIKVLEKMRRFGMGSDPRTAAILIDLASVQVWDDDLQAAEATVRQGIEILAQSTAELHPERNSAEVVLADVFVLKGDLDGARMLYERAIAVQKQLYGNNSMRAAETRGALAQIRLAQNNPADAARIVQEALEALTANASEAVRNHVTTGYLKTLLASALIELQQYPQAESEVREALAIFSKGPSSDHQYIASGEYFLGEILLATNRLDEANLALAASMNRWQRSDSPEWRAARSANALAEVEYRQGKIEQAEQRLLSSYRVLSTAKGAEPGAVEKARERVTRFYRDRAQPDKLNAVLMPRATAGVTP